MEVELNRAKTQLEHVDFAALKISDPYELAIRELRSKLSYGQHVTKAWMKMYEILVTTPLGSSLLEISKETRVLRAFFNAELPGAFIFATNHFLKLYDRDLKFVISSFYPQNQQGDFLGDQFGLLRRLPQSSLVGLIKTNQGQFWSNGDLTNPRVPGILAQLAKSKLGEIDFYTADGGFGVEGKEAEQEKLSLPLIRGEIETGLKVLRPGGLFLLKIFTFFTLEMVEYLNGLQRVFHYFNLVKPSTSAPMNSEVYILGIGYRPVATIPTNLPEVSPDLLRMRDELVQRQIRELNNFVSGHGQTVPIFPLEKIAPIPPEKRL